MVPATPARRVGRGRPPRHGWVWSVVLLLLLAVVAGLGAWLWSGAWTPLANWSTGASPVLVFESERLSDSPLIEDGHVLMPFLDFQKRIDPTALWDANDGLLILTTKDRLLVFPKDQVSAFVNDRETRISIPVRVVEGTAYVPLAAVSGYYGVNSRYVEATNTAIVDRESSPRLEGRASDRLWLRTSPSRFAGRLEKVAPGTVVRVFKEDRGFYFVRMPDGVLGYLKKGGIVLQGMVAGTGPTPTVPTALPSPVDLPLNLTWDLVGSAKARPAKYPDMPGLNVISPTWFHLDKDGIVESTADPDYVKAAHARGWSVWPLFGNNFDPRLSDAVLQDSNKRLDIIRQLLIQAQLSGFDGINIDWEDMNPDDKDLFSEFIRELTPLAHQAGLAVSVDVTFPGPSAYWQKCYDRAALGRTADYVILMGYDEYTTGSETPGPVAGFPWVTAGVSDTLKEVPADKVVLGVPLYARIWWHDDGTLQTRAIGVANVPPYLERTDAVVTVDDSRGLPLVQWQEDGRQQTMWAETPDTLRMRAALARQDRLAGIASWQRIFGDADVWAALDNGLKGR